MVTSCLNCTDRKPSCHSICERYITAKKAHNEAMEKDKSRRRTSYDHFSVVHNYKQPQK